MAKFLIPILFCVSLTIITGSGIDLDGIEHTYSIDIEVEEITNQVEPLPFYVNPMKKLHNNTWSGFHDIIINRRMIVKSKSNYNFTITTVMPFSQIDVVNFSWRNRNYWRLFAEDINIITTYVAETTPNQPQITKKYCPIEDYPRNISTALVSRMLALCSSLKTI